MRLVVEKVEDSSKLEQAFENYMASKVPYVKGVEEKGSKTAEEVLSKVFSSGPMIIKRGKK